MDSSGPNNFLIVIGAMKSGTTTLFRILAQHPEIAQSSISEPNFYSDDKIWELGMDHYKNLWQWLPQKHKIAMEASTSYSKYPLKPCVPQRMASNSSCSFRFVYIVRDPFQRIESHFRQGIYSGWNRSLDSGFCQSSHQIVITKYAEQIDRYLEFFPRSSLLVCTLDELKSAPSTLLKRICIHAGVNPNFEFRDLNVVNNPGTRYTRSKWINTMQKSTRLPARIIKKNLRLVLGPKRLDSLLNSRVAQVDRGRSKLTPDERAKILEFIGKDLQRMKSEFGIDPKQLWNIDIKSSDHD